MMASARRVTREVLRLQPRAMAVAGHATSSIDVDPTFNTAFENYHMCC